MSKLYLIPTPLGNLGDITYRAITTLKEVHLILAEDTRKTTILLNHYGIRKKLSSFHKFNEHKKLLRIAEILLGGDSIAIVTDAGTPGISDPGFLLVRECLRQGIDIECLPGPTALIPALVTSGFPSDRFVFEGFLPPKKGRQTRLKELAGETRTVILYESPHRLLKTLEQLAEHFGESREISISREITKIHEETVRGSMEQMIAYYTEKGVKGEIVIVIKGLD